MEMNISGGYVSADGHVVEPADLWTTRMDKRFRERAPRIEAGRKGDFYIIEGLAPFPVGFDGAAVNSRAEGKAMQTHFEFADTRPGAFDAKARLADQDLDHVRAEVIYPGIVGMVGYATPDAEYYREIARVYNDWMGEFSAEAPDRLLGVGLLPIRGPVEWIIEEAERVAKKGLRSVMLPIEVPGMYGRLKDSDRLWAALQDLDLPVAFHVATSATEEETPKVERLGVAVGLIEQKICTGERGLCDVIYAGIPQAFPKLRFILAEGGIGWIAAVLRLMDHWWEDHRGWMQPRLEEPPSTYFLRQFWATFEDDRAGLLTRELLNVDHLMWGSDYPHTEGVFPFSRERIAKDFADIPEDETLKIIGGNASQLYGL